MTFARRVLAAACGAAAVFGSAGAATFDVRDAEVISVNGNNLVVREGNRAYDYTPGTGTSFTVDGAPATLSTLRPGMRVTGSIAGPEPVAMSLVDLRDARVAHTMGGNLIVMAQDGVDYQFFSGGDLGERGVLVYREGQLVPLSSLMNGDRISATVVTKLPPKVMSGADVETFIEVERRKPATLKSIANTPKINRFAANVVRQPEDSSEGKGASAPTAAPPSTPAPPAPAPAAGAPAAAPPQPPAPKPSSPPAAAAAPAAPTSSPKTLPKTGSSAPAVALAGVILIGVGATLTLRRRLGART